jgi:hypothetical protein
LTIPLSPTSPPNLRSSPTSLRSVSPNIWLQHSTIKLFILTWLFFILFSF